jgi:endonuclease-8
MPEGDTVFRTAEALRKALVGRTLTRCDVRVPRYATVDLSGHVVDEVCSRGKHLFIRVGPASIHSHLKMDGSWRVTSRPSRADHRVRIILEANDIRAVGIDLGVLEILERANDGDVVDHLGPDLLGEDWDPKVAATNLTADPDRRIAEALLDQRIMAGIGNVYCAGERDRQPPTTGRPRPRHVVGQPLPAEALHHRRHAGWPATLGVRASGPKLPSLRHAHQA